MRVSMTPIDARAMRRGVLQQLVDEGAFCAASYPDQFFRLDGESAVAWQPRREVARRVCAGCPARAACAELALRDRDGRAADDDMVRGGLSGPELAAQYVLHADRLADAIEADRDTEGARLDALSVQLARTAIKNPDKAGGQRSASAAQAAQNTAVRELAGQVRTIRTARRVRAGWEAAA